MKPVMNGPLPWSGRPPQRSRQTFRELLDLEDARLPPGFHRSLLAAVLGDADSTSPSRPAPKPLLPF